MKKRRARHQPGASALKERKPFWRAAGGRRCGGRSRRGASKRMAASVPCRDTMWPRPYFRCQISLPGTQTAAASGGRGCADGGAVRRPVSGRARGASARPAGSGRRLRTRRASRRRTARGSALRRARRGGSAGRRRFPAGWRRSPPPGGRVRQLLPQLADKGGRHVRIVKQIQPRFCPRHGDVEQPPVLLIGALGVLRAVHAVRVGRQDAVVDIEQEDAVILEPLAAVDGRERQARVGRVAVGADELPERIEPREKRGGRGPQRGEHAEDRKFARVEPPLGDEPAVAHRTPDCADERLARRLRQRVQPRAGELLRGFAAGVRKIALREQAREHRRVRPRALSAQAANAASLRSWRRTYNRCAETACIVRRGGKRRISHTSQTMRCVKNVSSRAAAAEEDPRAPARR